MVAMVESTCGFCVQNTKRQLLLQRRYRTYVGHAVGACLDKSYFWVVLPIGDCLTMGAEDAIMKAAKYVGVDKVVGVHYDTSRISSRLITRRLLSALGTRVCTFICRISEVKSSYSSSKELGLHVSQASYPRWSVDHLCHFSFRPSLTPSRRSSTLVELLATYESASERSGN